MRVIAHRKHKVADGGLKTGTPAAPGPPTEPPGGGECAHTFQEQLAATPEGTAVREREATEPLRKLPEGPTRQERPLKSDCAPLGRPTNEVGQACSRQWRNRRERTGTTHVTLSELQRDHVTLSIPHRSGPLARIHRRSAAALLGFLPRKTSPRCQPGP